MPQSRVQSCPPAPALDLRLSSVFLQHPPPDRGGRQSPPQLFPRCWCRRLVWEPTRSTNVMQTSPGPSARTGRSKTRERSRRACRLLRRKDNSPTSRTLGPFLRVQIGPWVSGEALRDALTPGNRLGCCSWFLNSQHYFHWHNPMSLFWGSE